MRMLGDGWIGEMATAMGTKHLLASTFDLGHTLRVIGRLQHPVGSAISDILWSDDSLFFFFFFFIFIFFLLGWERLEEFFVFVRVLFWGGFGDLRMGSFSPSSLSLSVVSWETNKKRKEMNNGNFTGLPLVKWRVNVLGLLWNRPRPD